MKQIWQEFVINASVDTGSYLTNGDPQTQTLYQSLIQSWILDIITFMITKLVFTELPACQLVSFGCLSGVRVLSMWTYTWSSSPKDG